MELKICSRCSSANNWDAKFCKECGNSLSHREGEILNDQIDLTPPFNMEDAQNLSDRLTADYQSLAQMLPQLDDVRDRLLPELNAFLADIREKVNLLNVILAFYHQTPRQGAEPEVEITKEEYLEAT